MLKKKFLIHFKLYSAKPSYGNIDRHTTGRWSIVSGRLLTLYFEGSKLVRLLAEIEIMLSPQKIGIILEFILEFT